MNCLLSTSPHCISWKMIDPSPLLSAQDRSDKDVCMFFFVATAGEMLVVSAKLV
jgi:hypothetical protein